jgi:hypothetical protein
MALLTILDAINQALDQKMDHDSRVVVFGEDAGYEGGVLESLLVSKRNTVRIEYLILRSLKLP